MTAQTEHYEAHGADPRSIVPYVPRLTIEWLRDEPERLWQVVDGTLAFVDISGFTAMSERLAPLGKVGAEEVTEVMNGVFATLLEEAYAFGGGLLKFGGDALLLLYDGDGHARRAAAAAHSLRRALRALGRPKTSVGAVTLKMHVGVHSGPLHFFLVGGSHRELLLAGPGASRTVEMEATSEAGEILLSREAAALVDARALGEAKGDGILLRSAPRAERGLLELPDVAGVALEQAVPPAVRAEVSAGALEGEHRHAAIGFIRFSGTDALIAGRGGDAAAAALDGLVRIVQEAAERHEVAFLESDIDRDGGRIVLVAGAPQTTAEDEERLLRTVRAVVDAGPPLPVHVGVSRGRVFAGQVGAPFRRTYTVLGGTAATAARLMARAGANEIFTAADVLERVTAPFETVELKPLELKGKREPLRAARLGPLLEEAAATTPAAPAHKLPFVDRERERAVLGASVAPVRMGFGTLVELIGEPGIGKSRLAEELQELSADMRTLTVSCDQYASTTPYRPFRDFLRSLLEVELDGGAEANRGALVARLEALDPELAPWAPLLAAPLDVDVASTPEVDDLEPAFRRARLHGVVTAALGRLLDTPTLLLLEDVHWMDEPSAELLRHIGTQLPTRPWLACATRRPVEGGFLAAEGTPPLPAMTLRLEPLPEADAKALVEAAAGGRALAPEELDAIAERGAGNPLFLQELASAEESADASEELPENVQALVATRIDRLAPHDRALLRWASVLGTTFSGTMIAAVLADDASAAADSEAWDRLAEFVERDPDVPGAFRFRHALIRDAAYEGLSYRRRRELHCRIAEIGEHRFAGRTGEVVELLSLHFHRGGSHAKAWEYSVQAGDHAREKWANVEAAEFYRRALDAAKSLRQLDPAAVARVWEALGDSLQLSGELDEAAKAFTAARRLRPTGSNEEVTLLRKEGELREAMGSYSDALRWYGRGIKAAEHLRDAEERTRQRIGFKRARAVVRFRQGAFRECIQLFTEVVEEALAVDDTPNLASAYMLLHTVYTYLGSPERAAFRGLALPLYEELGDLWGQATALNNLGIEAYYEGDWAKALDVYERSRALFQRIGDVTSVAMAMNNIGEILSDQGNLEEANELFEASRRICETAGQRPLAAVAQANLGRAAARAGRFDEATELLKPAVATFRELHVTSFVLETEARIAEVEVLRGLHPRVAFSLVQAVVDGTGDAADMAALRATTLRLRAAASVQLGDLDAARDDLRTSISVARGAEAIYELALALDLSGAIGDDDAAEESEALMERLAVKQVVRPPLP